MSFPKINVIFKSTAMKTVERGNGGVVAVILKDSAENKGVKELYTVSEIPTTLEAANKEYLQQAFMGGKKAPKKVVAIVCEKTQNNINEALKALELYRINYVAVPGGTSQDVTALVNEVKQLRDTKARTIKAVVADNNANHEGVINFVTSDIKVGNKTYTAQKYTARIAGLLAGTPQEASVTFHTLAEVDDIATRISETTASEMIEAGKLTLFHDGEKVKIARGVNSLVSLSEDKGDEFKKIKIVDVMDMIKDDITRTANDNYIGVVQNSYENKCLLINGINGYFEELEVAGILEKGRNKAEIDIDATKAFLKALGKDVDSMKEAEIKSAGTRDRVFIKASVQILDAMETIEFVCHLI